MIKGLYGKDLARIITSEEFLRRLSISSRVTARKQKETAFAVFFDIYKGKFQVSDHETGGYTSMKTRDTSVGIETPAHMIGLLDHHFHTEFNGPVIPSNCDLEGLTGVIEHGKRKEDPNLKQLYCRNFGYGNTKIRYIRCIGKVRRNGDVEILFLQGRSYTPFPIGLIDIINEDFGRLFLNPAIAETEYLIENSGIKTDEIAAILNKYINAAVVNVRGKYLKSKSEMKAFRKEKLDCVEKTLERFGYDIKLEDFIYFNSDRSART